MLPGPGYEENHKQTGITKSDYKVITTQSRYLINWWGKSELETEYIIKPETSANI